MLGHETLPHCDSANKRTGHIVVGQPALTHVNTPAKKQRLEVDHSSWKDTSRWWYFRDIGCVCCFLHRPLTMDKQDTYWGRFYFANASLLSDGLNFCNVAKWILKFLPCRLENRSFRGRNELPFNLNHCSCVSSFWRHMYFSIKACYPMYIPVVKTS